MEQNDKPPVQSLRNMGNETEAAADEIAKWRGWLKKADGAFKPAQYRADAATPATKQQSQL